MRPPEVFVRELSPEEGARLKSISKRAKYQSKRQRAVILLASATGMSAPQIAAMARTDESHVRKVIHAFNERGFESLDPDYRGGRPKKTTPEQRDRIVAVARARPDTQGVPLTRWSLAKLSEHLAGTGIVLCEEALRQTLRAAGLSHQRTRSWKLSPDPDFAPKAERVLGLYRAKPDDGVVVCFDEMGPTPASARRPSASSRAGMRAERPLAATVRSASHASSVPLAPRERIRTPFAVRRRHQLDRVAALPSRHVLEREDAPPDVALDQGTAGEQYVRPGRIAAELVTGDHQADLPQRLARSRPVGEELVRDPGQELLDRPKAARQHGVGVAALGDRLAPLAQRGQCVALDDRHSLVGVREGAGGEQTRHARADHHRVLANMLLSHCLLLRAALD
jgi:transposase